VKTRLAIALVGSLLAAVAAGSFGIDQARADNMALGKSSALVRGGAPLPQFNTSFPIQIGNPDPVGAPKSDLEISLTSPDHSVLRFLFSPRSLAGVTPSVGTTPGAQYSGLAWNIFDNDRLFGSVALTGAVTRPLGNDPTTRLYGPLISLHSTFELGYAFDPRSSLSFDIDHANPAPLLGDRTGNVPGDNLRLQYGFHF
jgi:hypothetical protein